MWVYSPIYWNNRFSINYCIWYLEKVDAYNNRTATETITIYENKGSYTNNIKPTIPHYTKVYDVNKTNSEDDNIKLEPEEYEYHCERCDKRISEEEYIENCGLCLQKNF